MSVGFTAGIENDGYFDARERNEAELHYSTIFPDRSLKPFHQCKRCSKRLALFFLSKSFTKSWQLIWRLLRILLPIK